MFLALRSYGMEQPLVVRAGVRLAERLAVVARGGTRVEPHRQVQAFAATHAAADGDALEAPALRASLAALEARLAA